MGTVGRHKKHNNTDNIHNILSKTKEKGVRQIGTLLIFGKIQEFWVKINLLVTF
jgi:hypothetical protein